MSQDQLVIVFTDESTKRILEKGGTSAWRLRPKHARRCPYVLCTRNLNGNGANRPEEHHTGFLVGKLKDVVPDRDRYLIQFSEYAEVSIPGAWNKGNRNPIWYATAEVIGLDLSSLEWKPMPVRAENGANSEHSEHPVQAGLTLQDAKIGLAVTFGVAPEAIEITIRA